MAAVAKFLLGLVALVIFFSIAFHTPDMEDSGLEPGLVASYPQSIPCVFLAVLPFLSVIEAGLSEVRDCTSAHNHGRLRTLT